MILGIDPGKKGGLVFLSDEGHIVSIQPMPEIHNFPDFSGVKRCFIEKSQPMPGQGTVSMFNYGKHFGQILGVLAAFKIPHSLVSPRRWQAKMLGNFRNGSSKQAALAKASQLWPHETFIPERCRVPHDGIVDAALIAEYGRMFG